MLDTCDSYLTSRYTSTCETMMEADSSLLSNLNNLRINAHILLRKLIGASLSEPHISVVYRNTCIDQPCPSHSRDMDMLHMLMLACHIRPWPFHASARVRAWWWTVQCIVVIAIRPRTLTMGKRKAETPAQRTARLERERDKRTSSYLRFLVGVAILGFHVRQFSRWSLYTNPFSHFYIKHNTYTQHSGQDLLTRNAYGRATLSLSMPCRAMHIRLAPNDDNHLSSIPCMNNQRTTFSYTKKAGLDVMQNAFRSIPGLVSYAGVTERCHKMQSGDWPYPCNR